ncbi:MAG: WG repeat-containing protein [Prolixibacteraceae bacterium]
MKTGKIILMICFILAGTAVQAQLKPFYSGSNDKYGFKDNQGKEIVAPSYDLAYSFTEGMATVRLDGKYGYLDESGKEVVSPKYDFTWHFIGGFAAVKLGDKFGFIDKKGKEVVPLIYEEANNYHGTCCYKGMAHVKENGKWKIIQIKE